MGLVGFQGSRGVRGLGLGLGGLSGFWGLRVDEGFGFRV